jgi:hypothetical protein
LFSVVTETQPLSKSVIDLAFGVDFPKIKTLDGFRSACFGILLALFGRGLADFGRLLSRFRGRRSNVFAYLGINEAGDYRLFVSTFQLNPAGTRLERKERLPDNVYAQAQDARNGEAALAGLLSLHRFINGEEHGITELKFGEKPVMRRRRKKSE